MDRPSTGREEWPASTISGTLSNLTELGTMFIGGGNQLIIHGSKNLCFDNHVVRSRYLRASSDAQIKGFSNHYRFTMRLNSDSLRLPGHSSDYYGSHQSVLYSLRYKGPLTHRLDRTCIYPRRAIPKVEPGSTRLYTEASFIFIREWSRRMGRLLRRRRIHSQASQTFSQSTPFLY